MIVVERVRLGILSEILGKMINYRGEVVFLGFLGVRGVNFVVRILLNLVKYGTEI